MTDLHLERTELMEFMRVIEEQKQIGLGEINILSDIEELEQKIAPDGGETVLPL